MGPTIICSSLGEYVSDLVHYSRKYLLIERYFQLGKNIKKTDLDG